MLQVYRSTNLPFLADTFTISASNQTPLTFNMATESVNASVNGSYGSQQSYGSAETPTPAHAPGPATDATNGTSRSQPVTATAGSDTSGAAESNGNVSKDEVGWYFVEQYYTTLSRNPEKLHVSSLNRPIALHNCCCLQDWLISA